MYRERLICAPDFWTLKPTHWVSSSILGGGYPWTNYHHEWCLAKFWEGYTRASSLGAFNPVPRAGLESILSFSGKSRRAFRNCEHYKTQVLNYPYMSVSGYADGRYNGRAYFLTPYTRRLVALPEMPGNAEHLGRFMGLAAEQQRQLSDSLDVSEACRAMRPKFEGDADLLRNLVELKDFRDVHKFFNRGLSTVTSDHFRRNLISDVYTVERLKRSSIDPSESFSKAYLAYMLAIKPTIDAFVQACAACGNTAMAAQSQYAEQGSLWNNRHYRSQPLTLLNELVPQGGNTTFLGDGLSFKATVNRTLGYKYTYKFRTPYEALVRYWGLAGNLDVFYQLTPWTFVADMFATIGKSIRYMNTDYNTTLSETQFCSSIKCLGGIGCHAIPSAQNARLVVAGEFLDFHRTPTLISGMQFTSYVRRVQDPVWGPALPKLKLPSGGQALTLAAIARCFLQ